MWDLIRLAQRSPNRVIMAARVVALAALTAALAGVLATILRCPLKDDIAWLLYVAQQWLDGRVLYVDLAEVNPPLIIWISAIPVRLAQLTGIGAATAAMAMFTAIILGCAWLAGSLARTRQGVFNDRIILVSVIGCALLLLPGGEFGQREHLLIGMALPYLALVSREISGAPLAGWKSALIGVLAAVGCALKPHYLIAFGGVELYAVVQGVRLLRPVSLAAAATLVLYVAAVALFAPAYFTNGLPMSFGLYSVTDVPLSSLAWDSRTVLIGLLACLVLVGIGLPRQVRHPAPALEVPASGALAPESMARVAVLVVFAVGANIVYLMQSKSWFYHRLPATISVVLALLAITWLLLCQVSRRSIWRSLLPVAMALAMLVTFGERAYDRWNPRINEAVLGEVSTPERLERLIRREHAHSYMAFSEWIGLGFPVVNDTGVTWASRFDSMWALHDRIDRSLPPVDVKAWPVAQWVVADFLGSCPDLAVVDRRGAADYVGILAAASPDFRQAWKLYHPITAFNGIVVFRNSASPAERRAQRCFVDPGVPVAAK